MFESLVQEEPGCSLATAVAGCPCQLAEGVVLTADGCLLKLQEKNTQRRIQSRFCLHCVHYNVGLDNTV